MLGCVRAIFCDRQFSTFPKGFVTLVAILCIGKLILSLFFQRSFNRIGESFQFPGGIERSDRSGCRFGISEQGRSDHHYADSDQRKINENQTCKRMTMKKTVKIYHSFEDEEREDIEYWKNLPGFKKLEILEGIRANYWMSGNEHPPQFQKVYRIVKRSEG